MDIDREWLAGEYNRLLNQAEDEGKLDEFDAACLENNALAWLAGPHRYELPVERDIRLLENILGGC